MIEFKKIPGHEYLRHKDRHYIFYLSSGSYIMKNEIIKGFHTAWSDNRYVEISWNFQLNKDEYNKVHDTLNIGEWSNGVYFQSGYSIRVTDRIWFIKIIKILGL